jgi:hypothetical protein
VAGEDKRQGQRVHLRLIDSPPRADSELIEEMKRKAAAWEKTETEDRPVWLDEVGLELDEVEQLRSEGMPLHELRAIGRRLRREGSEISLAVFRGTLEKTDAGE